VKPAVAAPGLLLLACLLLVTAATAAEITLTTGQQDYYFLTGQPIGIPLAVTSTFPDGMPGTLLFSTDAQLQKTGTVMISTENRVFARTVPAGASFLNLTMSPSKVSRDYKVHVSYYYADPSPVNASLPEFYLHIVTDPGLVKDTAAPLVSTSRPETGEIPSASSVSMAEQTVGTREQMGSDSSGQSISGQPQAGSAAEREQQQRDREQREREQSEFDARLETDPLVMAVNASLSAEGFSRQVPDTQPAGNDTGTFSVLYRRGAEDRVVVQGSMAAGVVPSIRERANVPITADPALDANATFRSFARTLAEREFVHQETAVNRTLTGAVANITYATAGGIRAYVNASTEDNRVLRVSLEEDVSGSPVPAIVLIAAAGILVIFGWYMYRRNRQREGRAPEPGTAVSPPPFDHRTEAEWILNDAERAFARQEYTEAYGLAGRALRFFLGYEYGNRGEVTTPEVLILLRNAGRDTAGIESVLGQCGDVAFARGTPDAGEFSRLAGRIREMIRE
jgi:hypothetical protein